MGLGDVTAAELDKLRTLPSVTVTILGTILTGALLTAVVVVAGVDRQAQLTGLDALLAVVPFVQVGFILLGALPTAQEYAGHQLRTSLTAVPHRGHLVVSKTVVSASVVALTASVTVAAGVATAPITYLLLGEPQPASGVDLLALIGAAGYLTLIGLFAHAVALLLRHLLPSFVTVLSIVLVISPVLAGLTGHARWLPDRAAAQLYDLTDPVITAATGPLVTLAWIVLIGAAGTIQFIRRDA